MKLIGAFLLCATLVCLTVDRTNAQFVWTEYSGNPVIPEWSGYANDANGLKYAVEPTVLYDTTTGVYHMWFISEPDGYGARFSISSAISLDGKDWYTYLKNPILQTGPASSFDYASMDGPKVVFDGNQYKLYYMGTDGSGVYSIGLAVSADGKTWEKYSGNPVLARGDSSSWNSLGPDFFDVLEKDSTYYMWYDGYAVSSKNGGIGLASSKDGIAWSRYPSNPVFQPDTAGWDSDQVAVPSVVLVNGTFYMIYMGSSSVTGTYSFGLAYSSDGIHWTRAASNPVMVHGTGWENIGIGTNDIIFRDNQFFLWYSGKNNVTNHWQIGLATSPYDTTLLGINDTHKEALYSFDLQQNYPNPFNPSTVISYSLPRNDRVTLRIYDELGREIKTLVNEQESAGFHSLKFDASKLSSGVYFCRIEAGQHHDTKKLLLIK